MVRISLMFAVYVSIFVSIHIAPELEADYVVADGGLMRGEILEASPEQKPIEGVRVEIVSSDGKIYTVTSDENGEFEKSGLPGGRYTINAYKKGYRERTGISKVVIYRGETFGRIKMIKKPNIFTFYLRYFFTWQLVVGFVLGYAVALVLNSRRSGA